MPGPDGPWGDALVAAVREGSIDESVVDRKVPPHPEARPARRRARGFALGRAGLDRGRGRLRPNRSHRGHRAAREPRRAAVGPPRRSRGSPSSATTPRTPARRAAAARPSCPRRRCPRSPACAPRCPAPTSPTPCGAVVQDGLARPAARPDDQPGDGRSRCARRASSTPMARSCSSRTAARPRWSGSAADAPIRRVGDRRAHHPVHTRRQRIDPPRLRHGRPRPGLRRRRARSSTSRSCRSGDDLGAAFLAPRRRATASITVTAGVPIDVRFEST